jgi:hypothetical protein
MHDQTLTPLLCIKETVHLGAREDMRVHLDCTKAGSLSHVKLTIPFPRNKDSAGYSVTTTMLGDQFTALSTCEISTTQVFFPLGHELEIPTESMGREYCLLLVLSSFAQALRSGQLQRVLSVMVFACLCFIIPNYTHFCLLVLGYLSRLECRRPYHRSTIS